MSESVSGTLEERGILIFSLAAYGMRARRPNSRLVASATLALALVSLFFLLQVAPHSHAAGHDGPACRICQVAHLGIAPAASAALLSLVLLFFSDVQGMVSLHVAEPFFAKSASRAPPALTA